MVLDAETVVEIEFVRRRHFAPQLRVALSRVHAGLVPDVREMGKFHRPAAFRFIL